MSQCRVPPASTGSLGNLLTSCSSTPSGPIRAAITRPLDAPRSTPATTTPPVTTVPGLPVWRWAGYSRPNATRASMSRESSEEGCCHARVDRDEQARGERQVAAGECENRRGDVLWEDLFLEQRALRVERAEFFFLDAVDRGALGAPAAGEDA